MKTKNHTGFAAVEALLVVILIGILGGTGWYVWKSKSNSSQSLNNAAAAANSTSKSSKKNSEIVPSQTTKTDNSGTSGQTPSYSTVVDDYFVIKEYGIKFPYNNNPAGLRYTVKNSDGAAYIYFGSSQLKELANKYDKQNWCDFDGSLGGIYRSTSKPSQTASANYNGEVAHIGNYYYGYGHPQNGCTSTGDQTVGNEAFSEMNTLISQLKLMQAE